MAQRRTELAYGERIGRVVDYIADNLDRMLDLDRLAGIACFSPWHFHRVFVGMTGETVQDCIRRQRLHRAAVELIHGDRPLARIAARAGYGSASAFSRAFAAAYGQPPAAWRRSAAGPVPAPSRQGGMMMIATDQTAAHYDVSIEEFAATDVVALPHRGDYHKIGKAFDALVAWAVPRGLLTADMRSFGIYYDDPAGVAEKDLRSEACITAPADIEPGPGMHRTTVRGGRVARIVHRGPYATLPTAYAWLYHTWLLTSGEEPANAPCFEEYLNDPRQVAPQDLLTALRLPLTG